MTIPAVRARTKTVTRRRVDAWQSLKPGDRLTLIEKGMGLPKGAKQVVLAEVEIVDVRVEPVTAVITEPSGTTREGFEELSGFEFVSFWLRSHGYRAVYGELVPCRRIEWRYLP
jgi:hypothetical protein